MARLHREYLSTHRNECGSCLYSDVSTRRLECYCNEKKRTCKLDNSACCYYELDRSKDGYFWQKIYTWYVLTAVYDVLGIDKNNDMYQEIRTLIELTREDESTIKEAIGYNIYGVEIADKIRNDINNEEVCRYILTEYLQKIYYLIKINDQENAIIYYKKMVLDLINHYKEKENNLIDSKQLVKRI